MNWSIVQSRAEICARVFAVWAVVGLVAQSASADSITFAQFQQDVSGPGKPFVFTNSGPTSTFDTRNVSHGLNVPVDFQFKVANGYGPAGANIPAQLSISSVVEGTSIAVGGFALQPLETINLTITADTPVSGHSLLLEVTSDLIGSTGTLYGQNGGIGGTLSADTSPAVGNDFAYKSDFMSFGGASSEQYSLTFSSIVPQLLVSSHYLESFTAAGVGTFGATLTPEPASIVLLALGVLGVLAHRRRVFAAAPRAA